MNAGCYIGPNFGEYTDIVKKMIRDIELTEHYKKVRRWRNEGSLSGKGTVFDVSTMTVAKDRAGSMFRVSGLVRHETTTRIKGTVEFSHGISEPHEAEYCFSVDGDGNVKSIECSVESIDWEELRPIPEAELRAMHEREAGKTKEWLESPWGGGF